MTWLTKTAATLAAVGLGAWAVAETRPVERLAQTERDFAKLCVEKGVRHSFYEYFAEDGLSFGPHPEKLREATRRQPSPAPGQPRQRVLDWSPVFSDLAASGDLGFNTGPWVMTDATEAKRPPLHGYFFSIWKKQADGSFRVALDLGIGTEGPDKADVAPASWRAARSETYKPKQPSDAVAEAGGLKEAETAFSQAIAAKGLPAAYAARLSADFRLYADGSPPVTASDAAQAHLRQAESKGVRSFEPQHAEAAAAADFGYTWGAYAVTPKDASARAEKGYYVHAWRRTAKGEWRLVVEVLKPLPPEEER